MELISFLICFPAVVAALLFVINNNIARKIITVVGGTVIAVASIATCVAFLGTGAVFYDFESKIVDYLSVAVDAVICFIIIGFAVRYKNVLAGGLAVVQLALAAVLVFAIPGDVEVAQGLYIDSLSVLMTFIIGVIGSGICVYALGYMDDHQEHHPEVKDRRCFFFGIMFLFLSAMYVIVFCNNMEWLFTGWELTTLSSFLLIGYDQNEISIKNSFRQIIMNMVGGIGFACALIYCKAVLGTLDFNEFLNIGMYYGEVLIVFPLVCLSLAGITKAAQMPFHSWLLGAMVAPTPTSALLHSSTMVKAGVFLLVKMAPLFAISFVPQMFVIFIGGITFCMCSFLAISQSNGKRVLAYSTIANLGLIVACAGIGTPEAVWAACFLIMFHAAAKSLLFLCVGSAEHSIGSRDIEDMDLLFERMPKLARMMMLGIMVMFIAPFGMLIAKWGVLVSILTAGVVQIAFLVLLAFGSAATFMFWGKWLGKLSGISANGVKSIEWERHPSEWASQWLMAALCILGCVFMPWISTEVVGPYLLSTFQSAGSAIGSDNLWICAICSVFIIAVMLGAVSKGTNKKQVDIYMAGISVENRGRTFRNSMSSTTEATARNWYMEDWFGEGRLTVPSNVICSAIIILAFVAAVAQFAMNVM